MNLVRLTGGTSALPFPVYDDLVADLLAAHERDPTERDATVAHVLCAAAGYAYWPRRDPRLSRHRHSG
jgi:hypothetical protein